MFQPGWLLEHNEASRVDREYRPSFNGRSSRMVLTKRRERDIPDPLVEVDSTRFPAKMVAPLG
jgi:hypothetical protein